MTHLSFSDSLREALISPVEELKLEDRGVGHGIPLDQVFVGLVPRRLRLEHGRGCLPGDLDDAQSLVMVEC